MDNSHDSERQHKLARLKSELAASLDECARIRRRISEDALVNSLFDSFGDAAEPLERFTNWVLGSSTAFVALLIGNLSSIESLIGVLAIELSLALLLSSLFAGIGAKYCLFRIALLRAGRAASEQRTSTVLDEHQREEEALQLEAGQIGKEIDASVDYVRVFERVAGVFPWYAQWWVRHIYRRANADNAIGRATMAASIVNASLFLMFELFLGLAGLLVIAIAI